MVTPQPELKLESSAQLPPNIILYIFPFPQKQSKQHSKIHAKTACVFLQSWDPQLARCKLRYHESMGITWIWMWNVGVAFASSEARYSGYHDLVGRWDGKMNWIYPVYLGCHGPPNRYQHKYNSTRNKGLFNLIIWKPMVIKFWWG